MLWFSKENALIKNIYNQNIENLVEYQILTINNLGDIFYLLLLGIFLAFIINFIEVLCYRINRKQALSKGRIRGKHGISSKIMAKPLRYYETGVPPSKNLPPRLVRRQIFLF